MKHWQVCGEQVCNNATAAHQDTILWCDSHAVYLVIMCCSLDQSTQQTIMDDVAKLANGFVFGSSILCLSGNRLQLGIILRFKEAGDIREM